MDILNAIQKRDRLNERRYRHATDKRKAAENRWSVRNVVVQK